MTLLPDSTTSRSKTERATIRAMTEHLATLRCFAVSLTHNRADADDLLQDTLVRALNKLHLYQPNTNLRAWLFTIMHHHFIDTYRRANDRGRHIELSAELVSPRLAYSASQINAIELQDLVSALDALAPEQRSTLMLASLEGLQYEEIARITNVPAGTVRSRLSRARERVHRVAHGRYRNEEAS